MSWTCLLDLIVCGHETLEQLFYSFKFNQAKKELIVVLNVEKEPLCISYHHEHILHKRSLSNVIVLHNYHSYRTVMHSSSHSSTWLSTNHPLPVSRSVAQNTIRYLLVLERTALHKGKEINWKQSGIKISQEEKHLPVGCSGLVPRCTRAIAHAHIARALQRAPGFIFF